MQRGKGINSFLRRSRKDRKERAGSLLGRQTLEPQAFLQEKEQTHGRFVTST